MKFKKKLLLLLSTALMAQCMLSGCNLQIEDSSSYIVDVIPPKTISEELKAQVGSDLSKMEEVAGDQNLKLFMNMDNAEFCITDARNNQKYFSNPIDWTKDTKASDANKQLLGSQILVDYFMPDNNAGSMNSYKDSFLLGQINIKKIDQGVRVDYLIGSSSNKTSYPQAIRKDQYDKLFSKMKENEQSVVKGGYRLVDKSQSSEETINDTLRIYPGFKKYDAVYLLRANLGKKSLDQISNIFKSLGYTYEEVDKENAILEYVDESTLKASFLIPVEYKIDNGNFTAEIISKDIKYTKGFNLTKINLLPYFAAAGSDEKGYFFVPDGSGALININKDTANGVIYNQKIYGNDLAITQTNKTQYSNQAYLPVFGLKTINSSILGIVEKGEASGDIIANVAGVYSSYNNIYSCFNPKALDFLSFGNLMQADGTYVFPRKTSKENYKVRYLFIPGENTTYVDMAKEYRNYLIHTNVIGTKTTLSDVPFNLELVGAIDKRETVLGIPYNKIAPLTTFSQSMDIIKGLLENNIRSINLKYSGWANDGVSNSAYSGIKTLNGLGGRKEFIKLVEFAQSNNIGFYPDVELLYVYKDHAFDGFDSKTDVSRNINRQISIISQINPSTGSIRLESPLQKYVISPKMFSPYLASALKELSTLKVTGLSLSSIGTGVSADYNENNIIDRALGFNMIKSAMDEQLKGKYKILFDGCNAGLLQYASGLLNIPMDSSEFAISDESVPFYQIAIHGYIPYSGEALNMAKDYTNNLLKSFETGASLYSQWMYEENGVLIESKRKDLYSLSYKTWFDETVKLYLEYNNDIKNVINAVIVDHKKIADNVYLTEYDNKTITIVNYTDKSVDSGYGTINPKGYIMVKGDGSK